MIFICFQKVKNNINIEYQTYIKIIINVLKMRRRGEYYFCVNLLFLEEKDASNLEFG